MAKQRVLIVGGGLAGLAAANALKTFGIKAEVFEAAPALGEIGANQNSFDAEPTVNLDNGWQRDNLRAIAFVQERGTRRVLGAAVVGLSSK